ncbi:hypothetical protein [Hymenobacter radiodurans]|uniref:hypothetical protein n=1 Tax=Hymenobacter radiodurans TaxID=2496028 RepID=UPI001F104AA7|nr:hypothetical protein [Hymenobacter radiodurans]
MRLLHNSLPVLLTLAALASVSAQQPTATIYRATERRVNDLVHTKLDLQFDYKKRYAYGKEWLTLKPHAHPTDSLRLDAKGMDIQTVALMSNGTAQPLKFSYNDERNLRVNLGKKMPPALITPFTLSTQLSPTKPR